MAMKLFIQIMLLLLLSSIFKFVIMSIKHITYFTAVVITLFSCAQKLSPPEPLEISNEIIIPTKAIMIESATSNIGPCEPTICINPNNSQHIVAGAILDKIYVSRDGGLTWLSLIHI